MVENVVYAGRDLEAMSFALNYHKWILEEFHPCLGVRLVEVGAGTGSFSQMLAAYCPESLTLVEPSTAMHSLLLQRIQSLNSNVAIKTYNSIFRSVAAKIESEKPDSITYVNVLEHIDDDEGELEAVRQTCLLTFLAALARATSVFYLARCLFRRDTPDYIHLADNIRSHSAVRGRCPGLGPSQVARLALGRTRIRSR